MDDGEVVIVERRERALSFLDTLAEIAARIDPIPAASDEVDAYTPSQVKGPRRPRAQSEPWLRNEFTGIQSEVELKKEKELNTITLPQMLEKYSSIYNKNGRIGIYTRDERNTIIRRFHDKRKRRVWKKKIRYHCRKNLADSRVRVKGRFVKSEIKDDTTAEGETQARHTMNVLLLASQIESEGSESVGDEMEEGAPSRTTTTTTSGNDEEEEEEEEEEDNGGVFDEDSLRGTPTNGGRNVQNGPSGGSARHKRMRRHSIAY